MPPQVSALLLAAGSARRMVKLKQLLPLGERPAVRYCLDSLIEAGTGDIVAVVGHRADDVVNALAGLPVSFAFNRNPDSDMAESVRKGLPLIDPASTGVMICLSDHPLIAVDTFKALLNAHSEAPRKILIPRYAGRKGHPTLFPVDIIREIFSVATLRDIINKDSERLTFLDSPDEGVILDMDTAIDYETILGRLRKKDSSPGN